MRSSALAAVCVAAAAALCVGCGEDYDSHETREVSVTGTAEVRIVPDVVTVMVTVVTLDKDAVKSHAENDRITRDVLALARKTGIAEEDLRTGTVSLLPKERQEGDEPPVFEGYQAAKGITMVLRDLTKYDDLVKGLVQVGVRHIRGIDFTSSKAAEKMREARTLAVRNAKEKAQELASQLGETVGRPRAIYDETDAGAGGTGGLFADEDTEETIAPGTLSVKAAVRVEFELLDQGRE